MTTAAHLDDLRYFARTDPSDIGETGDEVEHLLSPGFYMREPKRFGDTVILEGRVVAQLVMDITPTPGPRRLTRRHGSGSHPPGEQVADVIEGHVEHRRGEDVATTYP